MLGTIERWHRRVAARHKTDLMLMQVDIILRVIFVVKIAFKPDYRLSILIILVHSGLRLVCWSQFATAIATVLRALAQIGRRASSIFRPVVAPSARRQAPHEATNHQDMPEGNAESDNAHQHKQADKRDMPYSAGPALKRLHQQQTNDASRFSARNQATLGKDNQPENDEADHQRPANDALVADAFGQVNDGEGDETEGQQDGRPAEKVVEETRNGG